MAAAAGVRRVWTEKEDTDLINCYLNVSGDAITGTGQKSITFWSRIRGHFLSLSTIDGIAERSQRSLQNRWAEINKEVKLFSGILAKIERDNESGKTEEDMIAKAKEEYAQRFGVILRNGNFRPKPFAFSHVWPILKKHPKWATKPPDTPTSVQSREERLSGSGRKALKRAREEAKDPIGSAMVTEMKRKNNALEDMNTMEVLRDPTTPAEERAEGMSLMRQKMMARLRAEVAEQAATDRTARVRRRIAPPAAGGEEVAATDGGDEGGGGGEQEE